jgi:hypothetical protein
MTKIEAARSAATTNFDKLMYSAILSLTKHYRVHIPETRKDGSSTVWIQRISLFKTFNSTDLREMALALRVAGFSNEFIATALDPNVARKTDTFDCQSDRVRREVLIRTRNSADLDPV